MGLLSAASVKTNDVSKARVLESIQVLAGYKSFVSQGPGFVWQLEERLPLLKLTWLPALPADGYLYVRAVRI
jgi:hypothetical protein